MIKKLFKDIYLLILNFIISPPKYALSEVGIVSVVCHDQLILFINLMKTLEFHSKLCFEIYIIDDGSLTKLDKILLRRKFLNIKIVNQHQSLLLLKKRYKNYKNFILNRSDKKSPTFKLKFDALLLNPFPRFIYLDSDILFFKKPAEIISWIHSKKREVLVSSVNSATKKLAYQSSAPDVSFRILFLKHNKINIDNLFISSLLCIPDKSILNVEIIDKTIKAFYKIKFPYYIHLEEIAVASVLSKNITKSLDEEKYCNHIDEIYAKNSQISNKTICVHFSGTSNKKKAYCYGFRETIRIVTNNFWHKFGHQGHSAT